MSVRITNLIVRDIRFPTSRQLDGSDAMNPDPDYSAAYVILETNTDLRGHGLTFTIGRGNEIVVTAIKALTALIVGRTVASITDSFGEFWRQFTGDSQLRWIGPEKGAIHLATAAIINAVWDLYAKHEEKPLWKLLSDLSPEQIVRCIDFRYITDALTPEEAYGILRRAAAGRKERETHILAEGYPAYTTSAGWLGYSDEKLRLLCREAVAQGWTHLKIKVGRDLEDDLRRCTIIREEIGWERRLMVDANQVWDVGKAIGWMKQLAPFKPWFIEEPTSPDDILGHASIARELQPLGIGVATGEHCQNRVMFKQFMQAEAMQFCQLDAARLGGVNEVLAVLLLAAKFGIPVCPHAGGVGLCEYVQHLSMFDYIAVSGSKEGRVIEYVDHLHEHFVDPVRMRGACYLAPQRPGYSIEMKEESLRQYEFPSGEAWHQELRRS